MVRFDKEADFEEKLIQTLQSNGWEKEVLHHPTEQELIQNWANILFENNRDIDRLNDCPLVPEDPSKCSRSQSLTSAVVRSVILKRAES